MMVTRSDIHAARLEHFTVSRFLTREPALPRQALGEHGSEEWRHVLRDEHREREVTRQASDDSRQRIGTTCAGREGEHLRFEVARRRQTGQIGRASCRERV